LISSFIFPEKIRGDLATMQVIMSEEFQICLGDPFKGVIGLLAISSGRAIVLSQNSCYSSSCDLRKMLILRT
jgi:hypothetical protein